MARDLKVGYGDLGPFNVASIRFLIAEALFAPLVPAFRSARPVVIDFSISGMNVGSY